MRLEVGNKMTEITASMHDQAELQGVLDTVATLGLALVRVAPLREPSGEVGGDPLQNG
jgi:hypothetical protein